MKQPTVLQLLAMVAIAAAVLSVFVAWSRCVEATTCAIEPVAAVEVAARPAPPKAPEPAIPAAAEPPPAAPPPPPAPAPEPVGRDWRVPRSIIKGILKVETRSVLREDDTIKYVDRRRGRHGERGPTQIKPVTFKRYRVHGESLSDLEQDMSVVLDITERILLYNYKHTKSWPRAVMAWNAGLSNLSAGRGYQRKVYSAGGLAFSEDGNDDTSSLCDLGCPTPGSELDAAEGGEQHLPDSPGFIFDWTETSRHDHRHGSPRWADYPRLRWLAYTDY